MTSATLSPVRDGHRASPPPPRARRRLFLTPYLFVAPFYVVFAAFGLYPLVFAFQLSFTDWKGAGEAHFIGLGNYTYLLTSPEFWSSLGNSAVMWLLIVPVQIVGGLAVAVLLANARLRARGLFRVVFIAPFVTPLVAMAQVWIVVFDTDYGLVNSLLNLVGLPDVAWLTSTAWAKPTLALLFLWKTTGFAIIILLAGLQAVPADVYEAAALDGASRRRQFWSLTLPLVRRSIAFLVVVQTLAVFQMFAEPFVVTQGGPYGSTTTSGLFLYNHITSSDLGTGAANSFLLVLLVFALSLLSVRLLRSRDE
ncbi:carbohydrate ABC transporter permease [Streptomyces rochei]|uniref:carbohydrate ABC transporter permease n=1 Tax=Streptomyces TaxID=1883 RepID=UPI0007838C0E|nr:MULTISPECIES: sugar ABC transporter permease [Streptomyces]WDI22850.1 sugar ABC transporter permease [Streptomyces enissocaesilis]KYK12997.1 sugar transporter [Streptomyces sp. CC71]MBQ0914682.1 sugar ABC transporter permease [Streptomyces sp. RM99]MBU8553846.1 sugar ABC transporter permease [Streptomyces sp. Osf17]MBU8560642.1 sugar ABC transporter permease [Streptomyces sp. Babs14]